MGETASGVSIYNRELDLYHTFFESSLNVEIFFFSLRACITLPLPY